MARAFDVRLDLSNVTPHVWRVLRLPADLRLDDLHHAIQAVIGWEDFRPHVFEVGDREYGPRPDEDRDPQEDEALHEHSAWAGEGNALTIEQAFAASPEGFLYIYDFDEDWRVLITYVGEADAEASDGIVCLAGEHAGPQQESRDLSPFTVEAANKRLRQSLRPRATPEYPARPTASSEQQLLANLSLVVLLLGSRPTRRGTREAWKNLRAEILEGLQEAGLIESDPQRRSVTITDAGVAHARRLLQRLREL